MEEVEKEWWWAWEVGGWRGLILTEAGKKGGGAKTGNDLSEEGRSLEEVLLGKTEVFTGLFAN